MEGAYAIAIPIFLFFYYIPTFIAFGRGHQSRGAIFALNTFAFMAGVPWIASFVWSLSGVWKGGRR